MKLNATQLAECPFLRTHQCIGVLQIALMNHIAPDQAAAISPYNYVPTASICIFFIVCFAISTGTSLHAPYSEAVLRVLVGSCTRRRGSALAHLVAAAYSRPLWNR
jgi:hypothetical protein